MTCAYFHLGTETDHVDAFQAAIKKTIRQALDEGLEADEFERARRKQLGDFLHTLNSPEAIANQVTEVRFMDADFFQVPDEIAALTLDEANAALRGHFKLDATAVSLVLPSGEAPESEEEEAA